MNIMASSYRRSRRSSNVSVKVTAHGAVD